MNEDVKNVVDISNEWLVNNINVLKELVDEYNKKSKPKDEPSETYSITLMRNDIKDNKSITIISNNKNEINSIKGFINKIDCYYSKDLKNVRYLYPQKATTPLFLGDELYYEYSVIKTDDSYITDDIEMTYEKYIRCINDSIKALNFYKSVMSFWEKLILRREIKSIDRLNLWYDVYIRDYI